MAIARNPNLCIDCPDPVALATFYADLLGWEVKVNDSEWVEAQGEDGSIAFQAVENYRTPEWPSQDVPQQTHLDFDVDDLDVGEKAVLELGATKPAHQPGESFRVFLDPAGHPFCLCRA